MDTRALRSPLAIPVTALLGALLLALPAPGTAQTPVYFSTTGDQVTGDNTPVSWSGKINKVSCTAAEPCYIPDEGADSYAADVYERPTGMGSGSDFSAYYGNIDIVESAVGYDDDYLYYRFVLYAGPLDQKYGFEINFDIDVNGDFFVEVDDPDNHASGAWESSHIEAYIDGDNSVGGADPGGAEGPGNINGYETKIYNHGNNQWPGAPGGGDAIVARYSGTTLDLAVKRVFLEAINGGTPVEKAAFRPLASVIPFAQGDYYIHDEFDRRKTGSPYPWLAQAGAPNKCPTSSDASLTATELAALESGTATPTAYENPCFPDFQLNAMDIGGTVQDISEPVFQFNVDMGIQKTVDRDSVSIGDPMAYTLTVSNLTSGSGNATGVGLVDTLPATVSLVSAIPSTGSCSGDPVVSCDLGTMANGSSATVEITVTGAGAGSAVNRGWVVVNEEDTIPANDMDAADAVVVYQGGVEAWADGVDTLPRVPSNGVSHGYTFQVSHDYSASKDVKLHAFPAGSGVVSVDSIRGPSVTPGPTPDSATLAARPRGAADVVVVWVTLADVAAGSADNLYLRAAVLSTPSQDDGWVRWRVARPAMSFAKSVSPTMGIAPGTELTYSLSFENTGSADAAGVLLMDFVPSQVSYKLSSTSLSLPAGITATSEFSDDGGSTWTYTPVSGGCGAPAGFDACVTRIRWSLDAPLPDPAGGDSTGTVAFVARVR